MTALVVACLVLVAVSIGVLVHSNRRRPSWDETESVEEFRAAMRRVPKRWS